MERLEIRLAQLLIKRGKTLAVAESCTGGLLANLLTNTPGSSRYFILGIVAYSNQAKTSLLRVSASLISRYGAVSRQVVQSMAKGVRRVARSDYAIAISGIAGPSGGTQAKPKGTVFICLATKHRLVTKGFHFSGSRLAVKRKAAISALSILKNIL